MPHTANWALLPNRDDQIQRPCAAPPPNSAPIGLTTHAEEGSPRVAGHAPRSPGNAKLAAAAQPDTDRKAETRRIRDRIRKLDQDLDNYRTIVWSQQAFNRAEV